jgi:hypothetical protein
MDLEAVDPADIDPTNLAPDDDAGQDRSREHDEDPEIDWFRDNDIPIPPLS